MYEVTKKENSYILKFNNNYSVILYTNQLDDDVL